MSNLTPELQDQITDEADELAANSTKPDTYRFGLESGYMSGATSYAEKWQAAEQLAGRYEKALKEIRKWELATGAKIKVKHLDILKEIMKTVNEALTPKPTTDE